MMNDDDEKRLIFGGSVNLTIALIIRRYITDIANRK